MELEELAIKDSFVFALANNQYKSASLDLSLVFKPNMTNKERFINEILTAINQNHYVQELKLRLVDNQQLARFLTVNRNLRSLELINIDLDHFVVKAINQHGLLTKLLLKDCSLDEAAQQKLNQNETLKHFSCNNIDFSLSNLLFNCNFGLVSLNLSNCKLTDRHAISLSRLNSLSSLKLAQNKFTKKGIEALSKLPIVELDLSLQIINEQSLEIIIRFESVRILTLNNCKLEDQLIAMLAKVKQLEVLRLNNNLIGSKGMNALASLPNLQCLELSQSKLENANLLFLANAKSLKELNISKSYAIDDESISILFKFQGLLKLNISSNKLSNFGAAQLTKHHSITHLNMSDNNLSIDCLGNTGRKSLIEELVLQNNKYISDKKVEYVSLYPNLTKLDLSNCDIGNKWAKFLASLSNVKHLNLSKNPKLSNEGAKLLAKSKSIIYLNLAGNDKIRSQSFSEFAKNKRLQNLALDPKYLNSKGGKALVNNCNIDNLLGPRGDLAMVRLLAIEQQNITRSKMVATCLDKYDGPRLVISIINQYLGFEGPRLNHLHPNNF